jgi:hypothetical protein
MDTLYYLAGIGFLALAKLKHVIRGYDSPKPYSLDEVDRCIDYDIMIAERFLDNLSRYGSISLEGKRVLELGPGSDLGVGLILVSKGASSYIGLDRHNLASNVPPTFYQRLAERASVDLSALSDGRVSFVAREDFDISACVSPGIDIVFSNAAFEHFDDVRATVRQLTQIVGPLAKLVVEIDLQTHSRWIREVDPNNIYRYPQWLYDRFRFPGQPNRWRPDDYVMEFERNGWSDISLWPENQLDHRKRSRRVHPSFQQQKLEWLSFVLCASRGGVTK